MSETPFLSFLEEAFTYFCSNIKHRGEFPIKDFSFVEKLTQKEKEENVSIFLSFCKERKMKNMNFSWSDAHSISEFYHVIVLSLDTERILSLSGEFSKEFSSILLDECMNIKIFHSREFSKIPFILSPDFSKGIFLGGGCSEKICVKRGTFPTTLVLKPENLLPSIFKIPNESVLKVFDALRDNKKLLFQKLNEIESDREMLRIIPPLIGILPNEEIHSFLSEKFPRYKNTLIVRGLTSKIVDENFFTFNELIEEYPLYGKDAFLKVFFNSEKWNFLNKKILTEERFFYLFSPKIISGFSFEREVIENTLSIFDVKVDEILFKMRAELLPLSLGEEKVESIIEVNKIILFSHLERDTTPLLILVLREMVLEHTLRIRRRYSPSLFREDASPSRSEIEFSSINFQGNIDPLSSFLTK